MPPDLYLQEWESQQPIYRQLRDRVAALLLEGGMAVDEALPSVRALALEYRINPLTVQRAYQELVDEGLVESRRGLGMFLRPGAREQLLELERSRFLEQEWPRVVARMERLGLRPADLLRTKEDVR
ncbi:GntR family transcriptional regulator [Terriglobus tenax]|uniref:GntR family transcriptional regulator n=1 Tax=Terriglobus tenax TaxID=1111115 RepID=UPI0021DFCB0F|nr:GntR family transcriptional regulator [Terriglobus tenax]